MMQKRINLLIIIIFFFFFAECHPLLQIAFDKNFISNISPHGVYTKIIDVNTTESQTPKRSVGTFNGQTSEVSTPRFINDEIEALYVTFNFLEKGGGDYQVLFSNCRAAVPYTVPGVRGQRSSSAEILLDKKRQEIVFIGKTDNERASSAIFRIPYTVRTSSLVSYYTTEFSMFSQFILNEVQSFMVVTEDMRYIEMIVYPHVILPFLN